MANTFTVTTSAQAKEQWQGLFNEMWAVTGSVGDQDAIADDVSVDLTLTVPGVALGDMVVGVAFSKSLADANSSLIASAFVSDANTVVLKLTNIDDAADAYDADTLTGGTFKLLIGRPNW